MSSSSPPSADLDPEAFDVWLTEVELANEALKKLSTGELSVEEFDRREKRRLDQKAREKKEEEEAKRRREEKERRGRSGKGEKMNYLVFCRHCFLEFTIKLEKCPQCGNELMNCEERIKELKV